MGALHRLPGARVCNLVPTIRESTYHPIGGLIGKLFGGHGSSNGGLGGSHGGGYAGGYTQQPGNAYVQGKPKRHGMGMGMGGVALGAGAGLLGGALIADAIDDYGDDRYEQGLWYLLLCISMARSDSPPQALMPVKIMAVVVLMVVLTSDRS
jgi:hypothetical protein